MLDVIALLLTRCAATGRSYWAWTPTERTELLGRSQSDFRRGAPSWVQDEVRPYLAPHAYLLGGYRDFHDLASFQRLTLCWRIFGKDRIGTEIGRVRSVLASWGYKLGDLRDTLLPAVISQMASTQVARTWRTWAPRSSIGPAPSSCCRAPAPTACSRCSGRRRRSGSATRRCS
jgi:hypothetical protein